MKVVSFSLWGDLPRYTVGALRNAELAARVYPSWVCRFYCGASVPPATLAALERHAHVEVVRMPDPGDWRASFWRFLPASDPEVEVMISRDTDSRLGPRERAAVDAWLASDRAFHVMRDHPWHCVPILAGMWGVRGDLLRNMRELMAWWPPGSWYHIDQQFLAVVVVPRVHDAWLVHDAYATGLPFPPPRAGRAFVGQPFDEHDRPLIDGPGPLVADLLRLRSRDAGMGRAARRIVRAARAVRSDAHGAALRLAARLRPPARPLPLPRRPSRVLLLQSEGAHKGQDGWTANWYLRECWALQAAFGRHGIDADVWGPGHEGFPSPPDFEAYDVLVCAEHDDLSWMPPLRRIRRPLKVHWLVDLHVRGPASYRRVSHECDLVLHATRTLMPGYARAVPRPRHVWFPNAVDDRWFDATRWARPKTRDVVFVGTPRAERAEALARLERAVGLECRFATGEDMLATIASARIHLNVPIGPDLPYRIFETIGLGTCLVTRVDPDLPALGFEDGVNCLLYRDVDEAAAKIRTSLADGSWARIGAAGYALSKRHTYVERVGEALRLLAPGASGPTPTA
jgi:hypothetical protein